MCACIFKLRYDALIHACISVCMCACHLIIASANVESFLRILEVKCQSRQFALHLPRGGGLRVLEVLSFHSIFPNPHKHMNDVGCLLERTYSFSTAQPNPEPPTYIPLHTSFSACTLRLSLWSSSDKELVSSAGTYFFGNCIVQIIFMCNQ